MSVRDLIPWARGNSQTPRFYRDEDRSPFLSLHREVNRLFDDVFRSFDSRFPAHTFGSFHTGWPSIEISETDQELKVAAELPGLEEKDMEILLGDGVLTLRGEKRSENEDGEKQLSERFYGRFERRITLDHEIEEDKVDARFRDGVLTITLPKSAKARSQLKRIPITN